MKLYITSFLVIFFLGILFAAPFPQSIDGTDLNLKDYNGNSEIGEAMYFNSNESEGVWIVINAITLSDWELITNGLNYTNETGLDCYYDSGEKSDEKGEYGYTSVNCYDGVKYYLIAYAVHGESKEYAFKKSIGIAKEVINFPKLSENENLSNETKIENDNKNGNELKKNNSCSLGLMILIASLLLAVCRQ